MQEGSYLQIEAGMPVRGTDAELGKVEQVVADVSADIFRGIIVTAGLFVHRQHFLEAEHVVSVSQGTVFVDLSQADVENLPNPSEN